MPLFPGCRTPPGVPSPPARALSAPCPASVWSLSLPLTATPRSLRPRRHRRSLQAYLEDASQMCTFQVPAGSSRCFSASPGACPPLHPNLLQLLLPRGPPPQVETLPSASKVRLGPALLLAPGGSTPWMDFAPTCLHLVLSTGPALPCSRYLPSIRKTGKLSGFPPARPSPSTLCPAASVGCAKQNATAPRKPAGRPRAVGPAVPSSFLLPPSSLLPLHSSPTSLLLWVYLAPCSFQLRHTQSCSHHLKSCSCPFSHG